MLILFLAYLYRIIYGFPDDLLEKFEFAAR